MLKEVADTDPWRPLAVLQRPLPSFSLRGGSQDKETPTNAIRRTPVYIDSQQVNETSTRAIQRTLELSKPAAAAPMSLIVAEYDQPRPWRYVRWRKANERQALPPSQLKGNQPKGNCVYKVLPGEGLADVAVKFDTYTEVLTEANKILNPQNVAIGQLLWVPKTHLIKRGNTLWSLSRSYGVSIASIQKANGIVNPDLIFAGDILVIPEELD